MVLGVLAEGDPQMNKLGKLNQYRIAQGKKPLKGMEGVHSEARRAVGVLRTEEAHDATAHRERYGHQPEDRQSMTAQETRRCMEVVARGRAT